jgi:fructosamine-3-kinase
MLHASTGETYGWHVDHGFGAVAIPNGPAYRWPEFWAERRLMAGIENLPPELARRLEALCRSLPDRLPATPRPALLHGDLWSGNVIARDGEVRGLIDPASYYGHTEVDLAMLDLFGRPEAAFWD